MADIPTVGSVSFSQLRGSTTNTGQGVSLGNLNLHNLNTPQRLGQVGASQTQGTSSKPPSFYSQATQTGIVGLYSMRLANPTYTGPAINAQRSSDNATLDFWADADGALTSATGNTFSSWLGSASANLLVWYDQSQNDMAVLKYPPAPLSGTANPTTVAVAGASYGNGNYTCSASTQYSTTECVAALFNDTGGSQQYSVNTVLYSTSTGAYQGAVTTTVSGTSYSGEWVQLQLPSAIYLTSYYRLAAYANSANQGIRNETSHILAGSNNGSTWTLLNSASEPNYTSSTTINLNITTAYSYYRLIARTVNPNGNGYWSLAQLTFYGRTALTPSRNALATTASGGRPPLIVPDPLSAITPYLVGTATANHSAPTSNVAIVLPGTSGNYINLGTTHPAKFSLATSNLFVEAWIYTGSVTTTQVIIGTMPLTVTAGGDDWGLYIDTDSKLKFFMNNTVPVTSIAMSSGTLALGQWYHVACAYNYVANQMYVYINGSMTGPSAFSGTPNYRNLSVLIGAGNGLQYPFNGYIRDLRVVQGGSVPTASFTADQAPFGFVTPAYTPVMGTPVLALDRQYFSNGKYIIYFPNGSATTAAYYGLTFSPQTIQAAMIQYRTISNPSTYQTFLAGSTNVSLKFLNNTLLATDSTDFLG